MKPGRRRFVEAGAAILAAPLMVHVEASAATASRARVSRIYGLTLGSKHEDIFMQGVRASAGMQVPSLALPERFGMSEWGNLVARLLALRGSRLLGLTVEHRYETLQEVFREVGAAIWCEGRHVIDEVPRHHFVSSSHSQGIGESLARCQREGEPVAWITEHPLHASLPTGSSTESMPRHGDWRVDTGALLARIAAGNWTPVAVRSGFSDGASEASPRSRRRNHESRYSSFVV